MTHIVVSLPNDNKYQHEQAVVARATALRLGVEMELFHASDDVISQGQQLLNVIQANPASLPDAIIVEPVSGAGLERVARAAVAAGIAWIVSNFNVEYLVELRNISSVPVFVVSQGQFDIGVTQGRQMAALAPSGTVLYIQGPATSPVSVQRRLGMESTKPQGLKLRSLHSRWSEESAQQALAAWLRLATSRAEHFRLIAAQTHELALGARSAFEAVPQSDERKRWLSLPFLGIGISSQVTNLVDCGLLTGAVTTSTTMDIAVELAVSAIQDKTTVPECTFVRTSSYPAIEELARKNRSSCRMPA